MDQEIKNKCEEQLKFLTELKRTGSILDNDRYKVLVCLAYEYIKGSEVNTGLYLLNQCSPEYFKEPQMQQMKADQMYSDVVVKLAAAILSLGLIDFTVGLTPTQPPGVA